MHTGVVCDHMGNKLSKQTGAEALNVKMQKKICVMHSAISGSRHPASAKTAIELLASRSSTGPKPEPSLMCYLSTRQVIPTSNIS